jgi:hypothetical protein
MNRGDLPWQQSMSAWFREHPTVREFAGRALTELPLALRSPLGARIGNDAVWAARVPSGVTGGLPNPRLYVRDAAGKVRETRPDEFINSSAGIARYHPLQSRLGTRAPEDGYLTHANRNAPASNLRTPGERRWWLDRIPGGRD